MPELFGFLQPAIAQLDPEFAHDLALAGLARLSSRPRALKQIADRAGADEARLAIELFGRKVSNPLIVAAGVDKNGKAVPALNALGFGIVEIGTVTLHPQAGNPKPRVFRLVEDDGIINRMGFPSAGAERIASNLIANPLGSFALNVGPNKDRIDHTAEDCLAVIRRLAIFGPRYIAINLSSPNTPGLRALQSKGRLGELIESLRSGMPMSGQGIPLLIKISPDIADADLEGVVKVATDAGLAGIIATNTTTRRPAGLQSQNARQQGGLSGAPLALLSDRVIERIGRISGGSMPVIAVGGVFSGADAARKIALGAVAVQLYTGFTYRGPSTATLIKRELLTELDRRGLGNIADLRGSALS